MRKVIHLQLYRPGVFGGTLNTTLCGKTQWQGGNAEDGGGNNVTNNPNEVTCKLCLKDRRFKDFKEEYNRIESYKNLDLISNKQIEDAFSKDGEA